MVPQPREALQPLKDLRATIHCTPLSEPYHAPHLPTPAQLHLSPRPFTHTTLPHLPPPVKTRKAFPPTHPSTSTFSFNPSTPPPIKQVRTQPTVSQTSLLPSRRSVHFKPRKCSPVVSRSAKNGRGGIKSGWRGVGKFFVLRLVLWLRLVGLGLGLGLGLMGGEGLVW